MNGMIRAPLLPRLEMQLQVSRVMPLMAALLLRPNLAPPETKNRPYLEPSAKLLPLEALVPMVLRPQENTRQVPTLPLVNLVPASSIPTSLPVLRVPVAAVLRLVTLSTAVVVRMFVVIPSTSDPTIAFPLASYWLWLGLA